MPRCGEGDLLRLLRIAVAGTPSALEVGAREDVVVEEEEEEVEVEEEVGGRGEEEDDGCNGSETSALGAPAVEASLAEISPLRGGRVRDRTKEKVEGRSRKGRREGTRGERERIRKDRHHMHTHTTHICSSGSFTEGFATVVIGTSFSPSPLPSPFFSFTLSFGTFSPSTSTTATAAFCGGVAV